VVLMVNALFRPVASGIVLRCLQDQQKRGELVGRKLPPGKGLGSVGAAALGRSGMTVNDRQIPHPELGATHKHGICGCVG